MEQNEEPTRRIAHALTATPRHQTATAAVLTLAGGLIAVGGLLIMVYRSQLASHLFGMGRLVGLPPFPEAGLDRVMVTGLAGYSAALLGALILAAGIVVATLVPARADWPAGEAVEGELREDVQPRG